VAKQLLIVLVFALGTITTRFFPTEERIQDRFALGQTYYAANDHENCVRIFREITETPNYSLLNVDAIDVSIGELVLPIRVAATYQVGNSHRNVGSTRLERSRNAAAEGDSALSKDRRAEAEAAFASAKESYRRIADKDAAPLHVRVMAQYQIVHADYQMESYPEVIEDARELLKRFPGSAYEEAAIYDMGWAYYYMEEYEKCIETFRKLMAVSEDALKLDRALFQMAESSFALSAYDQAIAWYERLVNQYDFAGMTEKELEAMKVQRLRGLVRETTRELVAKAQIRIGDTYAEQGEVDEAIGAYSLVSERYPQEQALVEKSYDSMADMVLNQRGVDAGVAVLRNAIENVDHRTFQAKAQLKIARALFDVERYGEAIDEYRVYVKAYGDIAAAVGYTLDRAYFMIAEAYREMGQSDADTAGGDLPAENSYYREAVTYYSMLLSEYPLSVRTAEATYGLGHAYRGLTMTDSAMVYFRKTVDRYPSASVAPYALVWQARLGFMEEDFEEAAALYRTLIQTYPESELVDQAQKDLGLSYKRLNRIEEAVVAFSRLSISSPFWAKAQAEAGDMLVAAGRLDEVDRVLGLNQAIQVAEEGGDKETVGELYYIKGRIARAKGARKEEVGHFSSVLKATSNPQLTAFALFFRGLAQYELGSREDAAGDSPVAVLHYERCVANLDSAVIYDISPQARSVAYRTRGTALTRLGRAAQAVRNYSELIRSALSAEERSDYQLLLMELYYDQRQLDEAERVAQEIVRGVFEDDREAGFFKKERAYSVLSSAYLEQKRYRDALAVASEGLAKFPDVGESAAMAFVVGRSLYFLEEYPRAARAFRTYIAHYPDRDEAPSAYYHLGYCYEIIGEYDRAAEAFGTMVDQFPQHALVPDALYRFGENLYNDRKFREALDAYMEVERRAPSTPFAPKALYSASWTYLDLDRPEDGIRTMRRLVATYPESDYARFAQFSIGDYYYSIKDYRTAQADYRKVAERFPTSEEAAKVKALLADLDEDLAGQEYDRVFPDFEKKNYDAAARGFRAIADQYPGTYSALAALANLGVALEHLGDVKGARRAYDRVIAAGDEDPENKDVVEFSKIRLKNL
jgi:outer membrane assembly lipoprotein YfiO